MVYSNAIQSLIAIIKVSGQYILVVLCWIKFLMQTSMLKLKVPVSSFMVGNAGPSLISPRNPNMAWKKDSSKSTLVLIDLNMFRVSRVEALVILAWLIWLCHYVIRLVFVQVDDSPENVQIVHNQNFWDRLMSTLKESFV